MSKGLGKIEREILTVLTNARKKNIKNGFSILRLARFVHHVAYLGFAGKLTHSQYTSVCRAVESLRRKNYVIVKPLKKGNKEFYSPSVERIRDATRIKIVEPGKRMYEEEEWLHWYRRWDI